MGRQDEDLTSRARDYESVQTAVGFVGWDGQDAHFDRGDPDGADGNQHTLVFVTLGGKNTSELKGPGGRQLICSLSAAAGFSVPPKGTRVYVVIPRGMEESPGAPMIVGTVKPDGRNNLVNGDVVIPAANGAAKIVIKNDGSVSLFTTEDGTDNGKSVYIRVAQDGIAFVAPWGTLKFDGTGFHVLHSSGASFDLGGIYGMPSPLDQLTSYVRMSAATINGRASAQSLGAGTGDPLAASTPTLAAIAALQTEVAAIAAALAAVAAITGLITPAHATAAAAATAAVETAAAALAVAEPLVPTSTSSS